MTAILRRPSRPTLAPTRLAAAVVTTTAMLAGTSHAQEPPPSPSFFSHPTTPSQVWEALKDREVVVSRRDGSEVRGRLVGWSPDAVVVMGSDGVPLTVALPDVRSVRPEAPAPVAPPPAFPPPLPPPPPEAPPRAQRHHERWFVRMGMGAGYATVSSEGSTLHGVPLVVDFGVGYSVVPNLALSFDIFGPAVLFDATATGGFQRTSTWAWGGFGVGLDYYFMPANVFLGVSLGATMFKTTLQGGELAQTDVGFMVAPKLGKEWWISANWGLGFEVQYAFSAVPDSTGTDTSGDAPAPPILLGHSFGALVTATYN